eukprot:15465323-Alexandrium_andersonii.AAC.1
MSARITWPALLPNAPSACARKENMALCGGARAMQCSVLCERRPAPARRCESLPVCAWLRLA